MNLHEFLAQDSACFSSAEPLIYFLIKADYPLLFFSRLLVILRTRGVDVQVINVELVHVASVYALLESEFLGQKKVYMLTGQTESGTASKLALYLAGYRGPHTVIVVSSTLSLKKPQHRKIIEVPKDIDSQLCKALTQFFAPTMVPVVMPFLQMALQRYEKLALDQAVLLIDYALVVGKNKEDFFTFCADRLIHPTQSLFQLAHYFFAQEGQRFFRQWRAVYQEYPLQFWLHFWSEQLWRAYNVVQLMTKNDAAGARAVAGRLPFSFIQRDWRAFSRPPALQRFVQAHQQLYEIDYRSKNGFITHELDWWYAQFFLSKTPSYKKVP